MCDGAPSADHYEGTFSLPGRRDVFAEVERRILEEIERRDYPPTAAFAIRLALEEAVSNAIAHGNAEDPKKFVEVRIDVSPDQVVIEVQDEGEGFDPTTVPDPTADENIDIPSGRGLMLIRSFMTSVEIPPPGNRIRMTYRRPAPTG